MPNYATAQLEDITAAKCPCGFSRRAFTDLEGRTATLHLVDIAEDARAHYHKKLSEIYVVLEGEGCMELDDDKVPVRPLTAVYIKPGCMHRAVGTLRVLVVPIPGHDPLDEWFE